MSIVLKELPKKTGIYQIIHITSGKFYIGSALNIYHRVKKHISELNLNRHHSRKLQGVWNKYGGDAFALNVIEYCSEDILIDREQHYLDLLKPKLNISKKAGSIKGYKHSEESKAKISKANKGRKFTEEHRKNIGESSKGRMPSDKARKLSSERIIKMNTGRKLTEEHKLKIIRTRMENKRKKEALLHD
jgi:group I intron endonuclease